MERERTLRIYGTRLQRFLVLSWRRSAPVLRQVLGWAFIVLGLLGMVLPVLQGVLFLVIGIALVGRRNRLIRWVGVHYKIFLRRWAASQNGLLRWSGRWALRAQQELSRQRRRLHWWIAERRRRDPVLRRLLEGDQ